MRPIWDRLAGVPAGASPEVAALSELEKSSREPLRHAIAAARQFGVDVVSVEGIAEAADIDLCAGCEVAAAGYLKQAYALWRSWFEQTVFTLYFLEAPLHREAWRVVDEIVPGKEPLSKLMLHELVSDRSHPFFIAYELRFEALNAALKLANNTKPEEALRFANYCLRDLSQGVHGTFNPQPVSSAAELPDALTRHGLPMLRRAATSAGVLCFAYAHALIGPTEQQLIAVRTDPREGEDPNLALLRPLVGALNRWLEFLRGRGKQKDGNRG